MQTHSKLVGVCSSLRQSTDSEGKYFDDEISDLTAEVVDLRRALDAAETKIRIEIVRNGTTRAEIIEAATLRKLEGEKKLTLEPTARPSSP